MGRLPWFPISLTFSTFGGREGWGGKGKTRGWILEEDEEEEERSGVRIGRFLGVTKMVMVRPWVARW